MCYNVPCYNISSSCGSKYNSDDTGVLDGAALPTQHVLQVCDLTVSTRTAKAMLHWMTAHVVGWCGVSVQQYNGLQGTWC